MKKVFIAILIVFSSSIELFAQDENKFQIWTDFSPSYELSKKWVLGGDLGYRIQPSSGGQTAYVRPTIIYKPGKIINFSVGVANFNSWNPDIFAVAEIRTFEYIKVAWPRIGNFQFKHRFALEQRWFYIPELGLDKFVHRSRYYLEIISPKFNLLGLTSPFFITANFEILRDLKNNEFGRLIDHNRFTIGMGNHITDRFRADVRFKLISFIDPITYDFTRELNIIRVRLYYQFASS